jgi:hypothetical protein
MKACRIVSKNTAALSLSKGAYRLGTVDLRSPAARQAQGYGFVRYRVIKP